MPAACLLHIDIQDKLLAAMAEPARVVRNSKLLGNIAQILDIPCLATVQYPKGLGDMTAELAEMVPSDAVHTKMAFSAFADAGFCDAVQAKFAQQGGDMQTGLVVLTGVESHVCVWQSALAAHELGMRVWVVEDAISARKPSDHATAVADMRGRGIEIVSTEMAAFRWTATADHPRFREIAALLR